jgi:hypothetical protein
MLMCESMRDRSMLETRWADDLHFAKERHSEPNLEFYGILFWLDLKSVDVICNGSARRKSVAAE